MSHTAVLAVAPAASHGQGAAQRSGEFGDLPLRDLGG
jgi:hypothetical protein